jgi:son of sevenless
MDLTAILERDRQELRETLQSIVKDMDDLKSILNMRSPAVEGIMRSIQEVCPTLFFWLPRLIIPLYFKELHDPNLGASQEDFRRGLWVLHEETSILPPMTDRKLCCLIVAFLLPIAACL